MFFSHPELRGRKGLKSEQRPVRIVLGICLQHRGNTLRLYGQHDVTMLRSGTTYDCMLFVMCAAELYHSRSEKNALASWPLE